VWETVEVADSLIGMSKQRSNFPRNDRAATLHTRLSTETSHPTPPARVKTNGRKAGFRQAPKVEFLLKAKEKTTKADEKASREAARRCLASRRRASRPTRVSHLPYSPSNAAHRRALA
jgi:hypothetical protein